MRRLPEQRPAIEVRPLGEPMNAAAMMNRSRVKRARAALLAHQVDDCRGSVTQARVELRADPAAILRDLLSDLRHWCDANGIDFAREDHSAYGIYSGEVVEARRIAREE